MTYYISPSGNNTNIGTLGSPWLTLAYACTRVTAPGDIIHVGVGTIIETSQSILAPGVNIEGAGPTYSIILSHIGGTTYTILLSSSLEGTNGNQHISGIKMDGDALTGYAAIQVQKRSNVLIHDCAFINFENNGVQFNGGTGDGMPSSTWATGNQFYNNTVTNCSKYVVGVEGRWALGINGQEGMLVYGNTMTQTQRAAGNNGYLIKGIDGFNKGLKIHNNTLTRASAVSGSFDFAIEFWDCRGGVEIYNNIIKGSIDIGGNSNSKGTYAYSYWVHDNTIGEAALNTYSTRGIIIELTTSDVIIERNYFNNIATGIYFPMIGHSHTISNIYIQYNIFNNIGSLTAANGWGIKGDADYTDQIVNNINIWNNVFIGNSSSAPNMYGMWLPYIGTATNISVRNNIITGFNYAPIFSTYYTGVSIDYLSIENNIFYGNGNSNVPLYANGLTPTHNTTQNNLTTAPPFVSSSDFHLTAERTGINVGLLVDYGGSVVDTPTIGVYEYDGVPHSFVPVISVTVTGAGGAIVINVNKGTLQMSAHIEPTNATDQTVTWSVINGTGSATISQSGLLTPITNGTVTVKATSNSH